MDASNPLEVAQSLTTSMLKGLVSAKLRPRDRSKWVKVTNLMDEQLIDFMTREVGDDESSDQGAGWIQQARRLQEVLDLVGRAVTGEEAATIAGQGGGSDDRRTSSRVSWNSDGGTALSRASLHDMRVCASCADVPPSTCLLICAHCRPHCRPGTVAQATTVSQLTEVMYEPATNLTEPRWVGKIATGAMFVVPQKMMDLNFTEVYRRKLSQNEKQFFGIPIGRRSSALPPLPTFYPLIDPSCLQRQPGKERCCVGFGLAAAMCVLGDHDWTRIRDLSLAAVLETESYGPRDWQQDIADEIDYFKHVLEKKQHLYEQFVRNASFDPSTLLPDDLAVCQVRHIA